MVLEPVELGLQIVVSCWVNGKRKLGAMKEASVLLNTEVFSMPSFLLLMMFPRQSSLGHMDSDSYSSLKNRILTQAGELDRGLDDLYINYPL